MSHERYHLGFMNEDEYRREQLRQEDMVKSIARGYSRREKEKALQRLSQLLGELQKIAEDLMETTKALKKSSSLLSYG